MKTPPRIEFESLQQFEEHLIAGNSLARTVFQDLDLRGHRDRILASDISGAVFLGCRFDDETLAYIHECGALHFPLIDGLPYRPYRGQLYTVESLYDEYVRGDNGSYERCLDARVFRHFLEAGGAHPSSIVDALAQRLHDHAITDALEEAIDGRQVVAIMGGHSMQRSDPGYQQVALLARSLSKAGFLLATGGGPGAMEAANLGSAFGRRSGAELADALVSMGRGPAVGPIVPWLDAAFSVRQRHFPDPTEMGSSVGIPTWLYGHEPPNVFPSHIAKFFANSVREEGLVSIALAGVIFAPGSAGTIQEVFQDATQNHYLTMGIASPMVFLGKKFWNETRPLFPLLRDMAVGKPYKALLLATDDIDEATGFICSFADRALPGIRKPQLPDA